MLGIHRLRQQWGITTQLLEGLKSPKEKQKYLTIPNADKDAEQQERFFTADENAKWYSDFGTQDGIFLQSWT